MANSADQPDNTSPRTRLTLVAKAKNHDADAWQRLVGLYAPLVSYWCRSAGLRSEETEDVVQEVFFAAAKSLSSFRHDRPGDTFRGWLRGITRNMLRASYRRRLREPAGEGGTDALRSIQAVPESFPDLPDEDSPEQNQGLYHRALELVRNEFELRTWQMFWQSAVDARPAADIAAEFSVSTAAVRKARSRVLHRLKQEVGDVSPNSSFDNA